MVRKDPVLLGLEWSESLLLSLVAAESSLHLSFSTVPACLFLIHASFFFMASVLQEIYGTVVLLPRPMALPLLIPLLPCNKNQLFNSSLCFMSQPFFVFCQDFASHPWLPSYFNSLLWWTKCHIYKSFCLNSFTISVDPTLRSCTWALRASRALTSLMYKTWLYPRHRVFVDSGTKQYPLLTWLNLLSSKFCACF